MCHGNGEHRHVASFRHRCAGVWIIRRRSPELARRSERRWCLWSNPGNRDFVGHDVKPDSGNLIRLAVC